jgi:hypothetical protein
MKKSNLFVNNMKQSNVFVNPNLGKKQINSKDVLNELAPGLRKYISKNSLIKCKITFDLNVITFNWEMLITFNHSLIVVSQRPDDYGKHTRDLNHWVYFNENQPSTNICGVWGNITQTKFNLEILKIIMEIEKKKNIIRIN